MPETRCAIYLRISQDREGDGLAIDRQREACEQLAAYRRWTVVETYVDQSRSATDKTKVRPRYDRMVADYHAGMFTAIVCYDLDRLTRQPRQLEDWIDAAEERGLALVTANGDADLSTDGGRMYARIKAAVARGEVDRKSARQKAAHQQRARQGRPPKGVRPIGYDLAGDVIDSEAAAVRAIYAAFLGEKGTLRGIARALSGEPDEHHAAVPKTPRHSRTLILERNERRRRENRKLPKEKQQKLREVPPADQAWPESSVLEILRNPRYAGYSVYTETKARSAAVAANAARRQRIEDGTARPEDAKRGRRRAWRDQIVVDEDGRPVLGQWEPLVDEDTWKAAQAKLDDPTRVTNHGTTGRKHLGSGLYLCGVCGLPVRGTARGYRCRTNGHLNRTGGDIDTLVRTGCAELLSKHGGVPAGDGPTAQAAGIEAALEEQRGRITRAERDYGAELIEAADLKRVRDGARQRIDDLERQRLAQRRPDGAALPLLGKEPDLVFLTGGLELQRRVIDALVTVTLLPAPRGRKGFDKESVRIELRHPR